MGPDNIPPSGEVSWNIYIYIDPWIVIKEQCVLLEPQGEVFTTNLYGHITVSISMNDMYQLIQ